MKSNIFAGEEEEEISGQKRSVLLNLQYSKCWPEGKKEWKYRRISDWVSDIGRLLMISVSSWYRVGSTQSTNSFEQL
ncbi:MAG: hypothetical protein JL50_09685 [Peptococcaceae bacterium BICA1-7]|nr:MAG: hypothetical protein JL50_09685 [Peptococcaceae bacterium BICA1-7]HBV95552.1 hypothetical protein [Desulfotomaculum sp.]